MAAPSTSPAVAQCKADSDQADGTLMQAGWTPWSGFSGVDLSKKIKTSNLRVEIWEKKEPPSVAVAFGGTIFRSGKDWKSNLRWFLPFHEGEYTEIVRVFDPAFVSGFTRRARESRGAYWGKATIYSTGHSLGGVGPAIRLFYADRRFSASSQTCVRIRCITRYGLLQRESKNA